MLDRGLFSDENGNIAVGTKNKILELLGYKGMSYWFSLPFFSLLSFCLCISICAHILLSTSAESFSVSKNAVCSAI